MTGPTNQLHELAKRIDTLVRERDEARDRNASIYDLLKAFDVYGTGGDASSCAREILMQLSESRTALDARIADLATARAELEVARADAARLRDVLQDAVPFLADHAEEVKDLAASWPDNPDGPGAAATASARVDRARAALAAPTDDTALQAFGLRVASRFLSMISRGEIIPLTDRTAEDVVAAVLGDGGR